MIVTTEMHLGVGVSSGARGEGCAQVAGVAVVFVFGIGVSFCLHLGLERSQLFQFLTQSLGIGGWGRVLGPQTC